MIYFFLCLFLITANPIIETFPVSAEAKGSEVLGEFSTSFKDGAEGRVNNIKRASELINETVLKPGEVFSYNQTVGPTVKRRGFSKAKIFVNGKESKGYGGGVCQVSSTLYNAALNAEMEIVERHPHSKRVYYVKEGRDAATSYGGVDLKFKNNRDFPIVIKSFIQDDNVHTKIEKSG